MREETNTRSERTSNEGMIIAGNQDDYIQRILQKYVMMFFCDSIHFRAIRSMVSKNGIFANWQ